MRPYETTFVIDSLPKTEDIEAIINKYERFIKANGGEIIRVERWGKRRLAYEIKKRQSGFYVYFRFSGPSNIPKLLEREYRLNESILRYLTIALDKKALLQETKGRRDRKVEDSPKNLLDDELIDDFSEFKDYEFTDDESEYLDEANDMKGFSNQPVEEIKPEIKPDAETKDTLSV